MKIKQTLRGSFSAVSKPNFASKYSLELAIYSTRRLRKGTWGETALAEIYTLHSFPPFLGRSLLYRRQILQVNTRWKALDEIYKICMLLHRSDLNVSAIFHRFFGEILTKFLRLESGAKECIV